jgi:hypothetical protein
MTAAGTLVSTTEPFSGVAFGNLVDLARLQAGTVSAEICSTCSTINIGSAPFCKCCSQKLPAFYASAKLRQEPPPGWRRAASKRAWALDLAAFWAVINFLVIITNFIPVP